MQSPSPSHQLQIVPLQFKLSLCKVWISDAYSSCSCIVTLQGRHPLFCLVTMSTTQDCSSHSRSSSACLGCMSVQCHSLAAQTAGESRECEAGLSRIRALLMVELRLQLSSFPSVQTSISSAISCKLNLACPRDFPQSLSRTFSAG